MRATDELRCAHCDTPMSAFSEHPHCRHGALCTLCARDLNRLSGEGRNR